MTAESLALYSGWASIVSFFVSLISLAYVRSIKSNIVKFRRQQRLRQIIEEIRSIPDDAVPLSPASKSKLVSLKRNIAISKLSDFSAKGRAALEVHKQIEAQDLAAIKEALYDWASFSEAL